jgi:hypothetical protein
MVGLEPIEHDIKEEGGVMRVDCSDRGRDLDLRN